MLTAYRWNSVPILNDCDVAANGNSGCGVQASKPNNYGKSFNAVGGGFYASERTSSFIKVWFWARNDPTVPADVVNAGGAVNTDAWVSVHTSYILASASGSECDARNPSYYKPVADI